MLSKIKSAFFIAAAVSIFLVPLKTDALGFVDAPQSVPLDQIFITPQGANSYVEGNNVIITEKKKSQIGSIFSTEQNKINLTEDFYSEMYIYLDGDADGVAFVMHNEPSKLVNFTGVLGHGLAIYGNSIAYNPMQVSGNQLRNSFAIEFDTYFNSDTYDSGLDRNGNRGHIAHTFPDKLSTYKISGSSIVGVNHSSIQYPTFKMGDAQWRLLKLDWKAWDAANMGQLTYQYGDMDPVKVAISKDTFGTDNVYWGFTGSTGALTEKAVVAFKSVPGLVNYTENVEFMNAEGQKIQSTVQDSEVTVHYTGMYHGGKQNMLDPVLSFELDKNQVYQEGTFLLNGTAVKPTYINNVLQIPLGKDLSTTDDEVNVEFKVKDTNLTTDAKLTMKATATAKNIISEKPASYNIMYDIEAPLGIGKLTFIDSNDVKAITEATDYRSFLFYYEDDNTPNDKITITLKPGQDIETAVSSIGPSEFVLTLTDKSGNARDVTIPIFVKDQSVVKSSKYIISGKDVEVAAKDYPKTEAALLALLREQGALKLWQYDDISVTALKNSQLTFSLGNLAKPPELAEAGIYEVIAAYGDGSTKVEKPLNLTVIQSFATVTISFVDEKNQSIMDDFSFEAPVAERIDLTKNQQLLEKLNAVKGLNYLKDSGPPDETNLLVIPEGVSRKYTFKGTLFIESAPNTIDFGDQKVSGQNKTFNDPNYDQHLVIWDNRATLGTWKITLKQSENFSIPGSKDHQLPDALRYQTADEEKVISTESQEVFRSNHQASGKYDISEETWGPKKQGLRFNAPVGSVKQVGKYETTLTWQIEEAY
jgi:hypothetical protein